jgi:hypothetical protein
VEWIIGILMYDGVKNQNTITPLITIAAYSQNQVRARDLVGGGLDEFGKSH